MRGTLRTLLRLALPVAAAAVVAIPAGAAAATAIGPNQYFVGNVNGATTSATILVGCFGPVTPGSTGHPLPNQYVYATQVSSSTTTNVGYTGTSANALVVSLSLLTPWGATGTYLIGTVTAYGTKLAIPTTLDLPCSATGNAVFTPTPTSSSAKPARVSVTVSGQP